MWPVGSCGRLNFSSKVASSLSGVIEKVALKDLGDLKQTIYLTRSTISSCMSNRPSDGAFDICLHSLQTSLEETEKLVGKFVVCSSDSVKSELLIEVGRMDIVVRQKTDQVHFLFVAQREEQAASKLTNLAARGMWTSAFGADTPMVPWGEFFPIFAKHASSHVSLSESDTATVGQFLDFTMDGWVSVYELEIYLLSFGPLVGSAERLLEPYRAGVLAGHVASLEASTLLYGHESGAFLVRFSKSNPGSFAVTFVDSKRRIKHCLLFPASPNGLTLREPPEIFPDLLAFVAAHCRRLQRGLGAQAHRPPPMHLPLASAYSAYSRDALDMPEELLDDRSLCVVCMNQVPTVCFIPCGHVCACRECASRLQETKEKKCPVCRNAIDSVQPIYLV